jgi:hypothetical protein
LPSFVRSALAASDGPQQIGNSMIENLSLISSVLTTVLDNEDARLELAEVVLANNHGPAAIGDKLVEHHDHWAEVINPALTDAQDDSREDLFEALLSGDVGCTALGEYLATNDDCWSNIMAPALSDRDSRLALVETILLVAEGEDSPVGEYLVDQPQHWALVVAPALRISDPDTTNSREALVGAVLLVGEDEVSPVGDYLADHDEAWRFVVEPSLNESYAYSLTQLAEELLCLREDGTIFGIEAIVKYLEENDPELEESPLQAFADFINGDNPEDPDYPYLKGAICGEAE